MTTSATSSPATPSHKDIVAANQREMQKETWFKSAQKFAVVGASANATKNGSKALKWLLEQRKDVVPINLKETEIQGLKCLKSISELPDLKNTAVCIVVKPSATLEIVKQAKELGVYGLWLQPGAEDEEVVKFIEADTQFEERCVYRTRAMHAPAPKRSHPLATSTNLPVMNAVSALGVGNGPITIQGPPCIFLKPTPIDDPHTH
ncbi:CoA binding domain-containing protein [Mycena rebaudengoi]|nr:CoA binding domain-containing protein [Mycena rebaudengoi]